MFDPAVSRRRVLKGAAIGAAALAVPAWARGGDLRSGLVRQGFDEVGGASIDLTVARGNRMIGGRAGHGIAVNGSVPGPLLRLTEGTTVKLNVHNRLDEDTSIHWHGLMVPFQLDGVPGVSFPGIRPGQSFTAEFPVRQSGTYWWHSHSNLQEQAGHYGPIVVAPAGADPVAADREYVLLLSEFTPLDPLVVMKKLKQMDGYFNYQRPTATDEYALSGEQRRMWGRMRMSPTDVLDVTGSTYTYLINGQGPQDNLEFLFNAGERIRLRIINGSAMSFFNLRIPGLPMTVVAADGQNVRPVEVDELQIGTAETYDVVIEPVGDRAFTFVSEAMDRSGMAVAAITPRAGLRGAVPALRDPPLLTMADMGMSSMGEGMAGHDGMDMGAGGHAGMDMGRAKSGGDMAGMDMAGMDMRDTSSLPPTVKVGPGVDMVAMNPVDRMGEPGIGLGEADHRVLTYRQLVALSPDKDDRTPSRMLEIHLTGSMERYMWTFDGKKFSAVDEEPIRFAYNERVRVKLVNDTMMAHPIHLHGHFFALVNGAPDGHQPLKHTVVVQPGGSAQFDLTADEPGDWAFHCHLLYHMHAGMFQIVAVAFPDGQTPSQATS